MLSNKCKMCSKYKTCSSVIAKPITASDDNQILESAKQRRRKKMTSCTIIDRTHIQETLFDS